MNQLGGSLKMKLTKNWKPLIGIYLIVGGLIGLVLSYGSCTCKDANNWWILIGLIIGFIMWLVHQSTPPEIKKIKKRRERK